MVGKTAGLGALLTAGVAAGFGAIWDLKAAVAGGVFGALATVVQSAAVAWVGPVAGGHHGALFRRHGLGMALRLAGVVAIPAAVLASREWFAPVPAAFGYLGVLIPLLFFETRLFR